MKTKKGKDLDLVNRIYIPIDQASNLVQDLKKHHLFWGDAGKILDKYQSPSISNQQN